MKEIILTKEDEIFLQNLANEKGISKRAIYIFQHLFLIEDFKKFIFEIRNNLEISKNGLSLKDDSKKISQYIYEYQFNGEGIGNDKIVFPKNISKKIYKYIEKVNISKYIHRMEWSDMFFFAILSEYILLNKLIGIYKNNFILTTIETYKDDRFDYDGDVELRMSIPISAKQDEVVDYIKNNWSFVELARKEILENKDFVKFSPRPQFARDIKILNKYNELINLTKEERKNKNIKYIESEVEKSLIKNGVKNIPSSDAIKRIVSDLKKKVNLLNQ